MSGKIQSSSSSSSSTSSTKTQSSSAAPKTETQPQKSSSKPQQNHDHAHISADAKRERSGSQLTDLIRGMRATFGADSKTTKTSDKPADEPTDKPAAPETPPLDDSKTLRMGEGLGGKPSDAVKQMQEALIKAGFGDILGAEGADGRFGKNTKEAVRQYQEQFMGKDEADGIVGKKTFGALNNGNEYTPAPTNPSDPSKPVSAADAQKHLLTLLAEGTNANRITNLDPDFAKDLSRMMADLQENHNFSPRLTSGWRPGHGSNHNSGSAADLTAAGKVPITDAQLAEFREVAANYGLKILDERHHGYNNDWSGAHLHISRTGH